MSESFPSEARAVRAGSRRCLVMVSGTLDAVLADGRAFTVTVDDGVRIPCVPIVEQLTAPASLVGRRVLVQGVGVWSLPGALLRIDADHLAPDEVMAPAWSHTPVAPSTTTDLPPEAPSE